MTTTIPPREFELHPARGRFNAAFFRVMGPYLEWTLRWRKRRLFAGLPSSIVELGSGVGANFRYLWPGDAVTAVEPNVYMHPRLRAAARRRGIRLEILARSAARTGIPDGSVDAVVSSLVLCTVEDPDAVLAEVRRILRPGGTFRFVEHVVAPSGTLTRLSQRLLRRPWAWRFEGCSCERDIAGSVRAAGFVSVVTEPYRIHTPFVPFNTHVAGTARA